MAAIERLTMLNESILPYLIAAQDAIRLGPGSIHANSQRAKSPGLRNTIHIMQSCTLPIFNPGAFLPIVNVLLAKFAMADDVITLDFSSTH